MNKTSMLVVFEHWMFIPSIVEFESQIGYSISWLIGWALWRLHIPQMIAEL